jgi:hypothetical protein
VWRLGYLIERWTGKPAPAGRVAEINGQTIFVFRAENDDAAQRIIRDKHSGFNPCPWMFRPSACRQTPTVARPQYEGDGLPAGAQDVHHDVHHRPHVRPPLAAATSGRRDQRLDVGPFVMRQVARELRRSFSGAEIGLLV